MPTLHRILRIKTEASCGTFAGTAPRLYTLSQTDDQRFVLVHSRLLPTGKRLRVKRPIESSSVRELVERLRELRIPVAPEPILGCDGGWTTLAIGNAELRW